MEKNGTTKNSKRTKHIKVRYFIIKDKVDQGEMNLRYCLTKQMWSDIFIKPLQGQKLRVMRAVIMNCPLDYDETIYKSKNERKSNDDNTE